MKGRLVVAVSTVVLTSAVAISVGVAAAQPSRVNPFRIPVDAGRPAAVPAADWIGNSPENPNNIPSRIVVLRRARAGAYWQPATGSTPPISATQALGLAWAELGPGSSPSSATTELVTTPDEGLVWMVTYGGEGCGTGYIGVFFPGENPLAPYATPRQDCTMTIELNAYTGEFISASPGGS